jgi:hypothetical protein
MAAVQGCRHLRDRRQHHGLVDRGKQDAKQDADDDSHPLAMGIDPAEIFWHWR